MAGLKGFQFLVGPVEFGARGFIILNLHSSLFDTKCFEHIKILINFSI